MRNPPLLLIGQGTSALSYRERRDGRLDARRETIREALEDNPMKTCRECGHPYHEDDGCCRETGICQG